MVRRALRISLLASSSVRAATHSFPSFAVFSAFFQVKTQVESQIKVRDLSTCSVSIAPADYSSWSEARAELMGEAKASLKNRVEAELAAAGEDDDLAKLKSKFAAEERAIEHTVDHEVHTFSASVDITYNFLSSGK